MDIGDLKTNLFSHTFFITTEEITTITIICKNLNWTLPSTLKISVYESLNFLASKIHNTLIKNWTLSWIIFISRNCQKT